MSRSVSPESRKVIGAGAMPARVAVGATSLSVTSRAEPLAESSKVRWAPSLKPLRFNGARMPCMPRPGLPPTLRKLSRPGLSTVTDRTVARMLTVLIPGPKKPPALIAMSLVIRESAKDSPLTKVKLPAWSSVTVSPLPLETCSWPLTMLEETVGTSRASSGSRRSWARAGRPRRPREVGREFDFRKRLNQDVAMRRNLQGSTGPIAPAAGARVPPPGLAEGPQQREAPGVDHATRAPLLDPDDAGAAGRTGPGTFSPFSHPPADGDRKG